jgi:hypothetical protein
LGADLLALLDALKIQKAVLAGLAGQPVWLQRFGRSA